MQVKLSAAIVVVARLLGFLGAAWCHYITNIFKMTFFRQKAWLGKNHISLLLAMSSNWARKN